jgi:DNA-binding GntR family transcriptional regulator
MSGVSGIAERIRLMLLRGEIGPGARLVELHLAERFRVEGSTLREALRRLEGEGLLMANDSGGMRLIGIDERDVAETLQVRAALEALTAGLAAAHVKDGHAAPAALGHLNVLAEAADSAISRNAPAAVLADRDFHCAVAELGGNELCRETLNRIWDRIVIAAAHSVADSDRAPHRDGEHRTLLAAVVAGDEDEASAIARRHVLAAVA